MEVEVEEVWVLRLLIQLLGSAIHKQQLGIQDLTRLELRKIATQE
jgi:hypothetical protein